MWQRLLQSVIFPIAGLGIAVHEVIFSQQDRPAILALAAALMGLPALLAVDRNKKKPPPPEDR